MRKDREKSQERIEARLRRGDLDGAIAESLAYVDAAPDDWAAVNALGELLVRRGDDEAALAQFGRVADHYHAEGFLARAAAIYKRMLRLREDDHALLSLIDISARERRLAEAKGYLLQLESQRRARGDDAGADECVRVFEAIIDARSQAETPELQAPDVAPVVEEGPDVEEASAGGTLDVEAHPSAPAQEDAPPPTPPLEVSPALAVGEPTAAPPADATPPPETLPPAARDRRGGSRARRTQRAPGPRAKARPLQSVFDEMRARERDADTVAAAHERFDLAQYHLREGDEDAAIRELQHAAEIPVLRFAAAAQLGRLHIARGEVGEGITWLERAAASPPVTPDEGLAVLYELADALEQVGQEARALAVFLDLQAQRRTFRDLAARIDRLSQAMDGDQ